MGAKALYNKMVEEKVKEGRQKFGMKKKPKVTDAMIKKLFEKAKKARAKEQAKLKKVKKKVAAAQKNVKTAGADATAAKNEVNKLKGMDLKALLAQAGNILKP